MQPLVNPAVHPLLIAVPFDPLDDKTKMVSLFNFKIIYFFHLAPNMID